MRVVVRLRRNGNDDETSRQPNRRLNRRVVIRNVFQHFEERNDVERTLRKTGFFKLAGITVKVGNAARAKRFVKFAPMRQKVDRRRLDMRERVEENPKENAATGADFEERFERFAAEPSENRSNARELVARVFETIKFQLRRFAELENAFNLRRTEVVERRFEEFRRERKRRLVDFFVERADDASVGESVQR